MSSIHKVIYQYKSNFSFFRIEGEASPKTSHPEEIDNYSDEWPSNGSIEFKNYYVKYRPNLPQVIKDLSVRIAHGEKVLY